MFERRHYAYLVDTIIHDPDVTNYNKGVWLDTLRRWFTRDFPNFNGVKWDAAVTDSVAVREVFPDETSP